VLHQDSFTLCAPQDQLEKLVTRLLAHETDVNKSDERRLRPVHCAASRRSLSIFQLLLVKGAEVPAQGGYFGNALQAASLNGHEKIVELLFSNGADAICLRWRTRQRTAGSLVWEATRRSSSCSARAWRSTLKMETTVMRCRRPRLEATRRLCSYWSARARRYHRHHQRF
jgi:hypothetical protein